jgi:solute carrier family 35, member C2
MLKTLIFLKQLKTNNKFKIMSLINTYNNIELRSILISLSTILIYYFFSISLTFYNRYLFVNYKYPLSITVIHLVVKYLIGALIRSIWNIVAAKKQENYKKRITLEWSTYLRKIIPMAIASALDIGLSNWSLQYITVTLYTMSKSTVILFILFFSLLFKLEKWVSDLNTITVCTILKYGLR